MLPATTERVALNTSACVNQQIQEQLERSIEYYRGAPHWEIETRLQELNQEWDVERMIETNASVLALAGLGLGATVDRRFFAVPALIATFLLQHAVQGWCPPIPMLRRLGYRTQSEIEQERYALKALRGDFSSLSELSPTEAIVAATE